LLKGFSDMAIDMHAHWTPRGLLDAAARGGDWYGWKLLHDRDGQEHVSFGERVIPFAVSSSILNDPATRAAKRKKLDGIHCESLILTGLFWNYHVDEADALRFCSEVNEEVSEVQRAYPKEFVGVAVLPMQHPTAALRAMDYAVDQLGLRAVCLATNVRGMNLDEPTVMPILDAAAKRNVAIVVHPTIWDKIGDSRMPRYHFWNSFGAPLESSAAAMSLVYGGLLDRNPDIRIMFTQGGGWIHFGVGRLELRYQQREDARPMSQSPLNYLHRMFYDCLVHDVDSLGLLIKRATAQRVMVGTDFPAGGDIPGGAARWISQCEFLSDDDKESILWRNAASFLKLDSELAKPPQD
jgi:aminocarboxymuconate-semialdehyde decarboxylase